MIQVLPALDAGFQLVIAADDARLTSSRGRGELFLTQPEQISHCIFILVPQVTVRALEDEIRTCLA